jgi:hypothetical protein
MPKRNRDRSAGTGVHEDAGQYNAICTRPSRLSYLEPEQIIPSVTQSIWEGAGPRLRAVMEGLHQRANEGQALPPSAWACRLLAKLPVPECVGQISPPYPQREPAQEALGE